ncbi:hypothetical protein IKI14_04705 [bacterium]|nr:hypothetical protein [bacterium]
MYVFAENLSNGAIDLNIDPSNAIQHFKEVKIISSGVNDESYAIINKKGNLI